MPPERVTSDIPVPLMLEQLRGTAAWRLMEERLEWTLGRRIDAMSAMPGDANIGEIQRLLGQIEMLRLVLKQPEKLQQEWDKARRSNQQTEGRT